jgi:cystathionine beta-lyase
MIWNFDENVEREGTFCVKYDLRKEIFGKHDVIPMWVADMDFKTPEFVITAIRKRLDHEICGYSFRPPEYFTTISAWMKNRHGWIIDNDWICFSPGIVPALNFCTLAYTKPGDSIIVQPPVYFPFFSAVEAHGRKLIFNNLKESDGKYRMDFEQLMKIITPDTRMIMISNPHNPVGRIWTREELETLADICLRNNILILSDEIHSDLVMPGYKHIPLASLSEEIASKTITLIAPSKTFNLAGLSTSSVIISNPELRKSFNAIVENLHVGNGNLFGTIASVSAYTHGQEWLEQLITYLSGNIRIVEDFCRERIPQIIPVTTEATYMIWLDCRKLGMKGRELNSFFINQAGVGLNEGSTFGNGGEGYMRMNVATTRKTLQKALEQIEKAVSDLNEKSN